MKKKKPKNPLHNGRKILEITKAAPYKLGKKRIQNFNSFRKMLAIRSIYKYLEHNKPVRTKLKKTKKKKKKSYDH
jgi:hypothetical protein